MIKPINFKPKNTDMPIIELLMESGNYKNQSDLVRQALWQLAISKHGEAAINKAGSDIADQLRDMYQ